MSSTRDAPGAPQWLQGVRLTGDSARFAVCVEKAVPVASGAWHGQVSVKVLARSLARLQSPRPRDDGTSRAKECTRLIWRAIVPSALQPRKDFGRDALQELIDSIRQHGIIQPLIVRQVGRAI